MSTSTPNRAAKGAASPQNFAGLPAGFAQQFQDFLGRPGGLMIGGEWVEAASGKTFKTLEPAIEAAPGRVARRGGGHRGRRARASSEL